jgi:hypothetical protein
VASWPEKVLGAAKKAFLWGFRTTFMFLKVFNISPGVFNVSNRGVRSLAQER